MNLMDKNRELNNIMERFKDALKVYDNVGVTVYVETKYFGDSYDISNVPASLYLVKKDEDSDYECVETILNGLTCYFIVNVISTEEFIGNYKDSSTLIGDIN